MEDSIISKNILEQAKITTQDLRIEIATHLHDQERRSIDQARKLAGLGLISFQKELAKRVGTSQQQISRLESTSYEGHSLSMLRSR